MHRINLYQTLLTEGQWSYCRHRKYSLGSVFEAIRYLPVSGCQWRMHPKDFPKWQLVYKYFRKWWEDGRIEHFIEKTVMRIIRNRNLTKEIPWWQQDEITIKLKPTINNMKGAFPPELLSAFDPSFQSHSPLYSLG